MVKIIIILILSVFLILTVCGQQIQTDLILFNGKIFTANLEKPFVEAVAITGEHIVAVGSSIEIEKLAGSRTQKIDLKQQVVVPGFNDAHCHFSSSPEYVWLQFDSIEPSWEETRTAIEQAVKKTPTGIWICGSVGSDVILNNKVNRFEIDLLAPDHPVWISAWTGHGSILNSKAILLLHVNLEEPDLMGGSYERVTDSNEINGRLWEYAEFRLSRILNDQVSDENIIKDIHKIVDTAVSLGITSLQIFPYISIDRFTRLLDKIDLPIRLRAIPFSLTIPTGRDLSEIRQLGNLRIKQSKLTIGGMKWILDGTPVERGAALRNDYNDLPGWRGKLNFPMSEVEAMIQESIDFKQQLLVHCVGDKTIESVLDAMENQSTKVDWPRKRLRIEHGDGMIDDLIPRARKLGVIVVQNPTHFSQSELFRERWGTGMQPLRSLIEAGIPVAFGSDGPMNPYLNIMLATTHPYNPKEAITREQAVYAYTHLAAFAEFAENEKGTIAKGKLADLVVLSQDIFSMPGSELEKTTCVLTIVGGKIVYDANVLK